MLTRRTPLRLFTLLAFTVALSAVAHAQATRTWVSGVGDDVNPCSRTAPCKTFAGAISKTAANGEIDCLDPGGFGTVTITKGMTIDGTTGAGFGSILAAGTNGVNVNDSATATPNTITVTLRNLSINGAGTGFDGVRFTSGKNLYIEGCNIFNFRGNGTNSDGLEITLNGSLLTFSVHVQDTRFENNTGDGIRMGVTGSTLNSSFDNVRLGGNNNGLEVTGGTANISRSVIDNNAANGLNVTGGAFINSSSNQITSNGNGVNNTASTVRLSDCNIYRNATGLAGAGTYNSFGNNHILGNTSDGIVPPITNPK